MPKFSIIAGFLMLIFTSIPTALTSASPQEKITFEQNKHNAYIVAQKERIKTLFAQLGQHRSEILLQAAKNGIHIDPSQEDQTELQLEADLQALGVKTISLNEALAIQNNSNDVANQVTVPGSNSNVRWYDLRYTYYTGGKTYAVQELYARGLAAGTNLMAGQLGARLYTNKQVIVKNFWYLTSMYVQKAIGVIKIVEWLPYELLFSDNSNVTNNNYEVTHLSLQTVCFSYVKLNGQSDDWQDLSYVSNMVNVSSTHILSGFNNGVQYTSSKDKVNTDYATNYASASSAVNAYINIQAPRYSFVSFYRFFNHDQTASLTQYIINPIVPVQITQ